MRLTSVGWKCLLIYFVVLLSAGCVRVKSTTKIEGIKVDVTSHVTVSRMDLTNERATTCTIKVVRHRTKTGFVAGVETWEEVSTHRKLEPGETVSDVEISSEDVLQIYDETGNLLAIKALDDLI